MGTSFVYITPVSQSGADTFGFWIHDSILALWLRLLALHLPNPHDDGTYKVSLDIRNQWLVASLGCFQGCVPHGMEDACATSEGREVVRIAIKSLNDALEVIDNPIPKDALNLLGIEGIVFEAPEEKKRIQEIGYAFLDLLDGKLTSTVSSSSGISPGTIPYPPQTKDN